MPIVKRLSLKTRFLILIVFSCVWISYLFIDAYSQSVYVKHYLNDWMDREYYRFIVCPGDGLTSTLEDVMFGGFMPFISALMTLLLCLRLDRRKINGG